MRTFTQIALIAAISVAAAATTFLIKGPPQRLLACDPALLKADEVCLDQLPPDREFVWVDARSRVEWQESGVPGSILWNLDPAEDMQAFEVEAATRIAVTPDVIVYCSDENCGVSRQVAGRIRALGLGAEVRVLHGGWQALKQAGRVAGPKP